MSALRFLDEVRFRTHKTADARVAPDGWPHVVNVYPGARGVVIHHYGNDAVEVEVHTVDPDVYVTTAVAGSDVEPAR